MISEEFSNKFKMLSFVMTCVMVFYHCPRIDNIEYWGHIDKILQTFFLNIFDKSGCVVMSYFFSVTGYLLFRDLTFSNYALKVKKRFWSLLLPYILWQCIWGVIFSFVEDYYSIRYFLGVTFGMVTYPPDGALWYLYAVFLLAVLSPVGLIFMKDRRNAFIFVLISTIGLEYIVANGIFKDIVQYGFINNVVYYLPTYMIGAYYGRYVGCEKQSNVLKELLIIIGCAIIFDSFFEGYLYKVTMACLPMLLLYILPNTPNAYNKEIYSLSFIIFALHQPLIKIIWPKLISLMIKIFPIGVICTLMSRCIMFVIVLGAAYIIRMFLRKRFALALRLLTGGRS